MLAAAVLWGVFMWLLLRGCKRDRTAGLICLAFLMVAIFLIIYSTLIGRTGEAGSAGTFNWIPFHFIYKAATIRIEYLRSALMNSFLFMPVGMTLPFTICAYFSNRGAARQGAAGRHPIVTTVLFAFAFSACIEFLQFILCVGCAETDDIIMNTLGAFAGCISWKITTKMLQKQ